MFTKTGRRGDELMIENAQIRFKNFGGAESRFNREGKRTFCVLLTPDAAEILEQDGWNVKYLKPREEGDPEQAYMQVTVNFKGRGPNVFTITSRGETRLDEESIHILDWAEMVKVDLIIRPYHWESKTIAPYKGITAYLQTMYATLYENPLEVKYSLDPNAPETARDIVLSEDVDYD